MSNTIDVISQQLWFLCDRYWRWYTARKQVSGGLKIIENFFLSFEVFEYILKHLCPFYTLKNFSKFLGALAWNVLGFVFKNVYNLFSKFLSWPWISLNFIVEPRWNDWRYIRQNATIVPPSLSSLNIMCHTWKYKYFHVPRWLEGPEYCYLLYYF